MTELSVLDSTMHYQEPNHPSRHRLAALPDGSFDGVRADRMGQHVADPAAALVEMVRVLRPGREVVIADPDQETPDDQRPRNSPVDHGSPEGGRVQAVAASPCFNNSMLSFSEGFKKSNVSRGRLFNRNATLSSRLESAPQVGAFREVLAQQAVGVLVGAALPDCGRRRRTPGCRWPR
jgi:SAM-dependent methyltransferase